MQQQLDAIDGDKRLSAVQVWALTLLRIAIGWHFLYEGLVKIFNPDWTSADYLMQSGGFLSGFFRGIAESPGALSMVDFLNQAGLVLVGAGLLLGLFTRLSACGGILMLALYFLAGPAFGYATAVEGSYLIVDKNLVELLALTIVLLLPTSRQTGLDYWIARLWNRKLRTPRAPSHVNDPNVEILYPPPGSNLIRGRRVVLKTFASLPFLAAFVAAFFRKRSLQSREEQALLDDPVDAVSGATLKSFTRTSLKELKGQVPHGKIGELDLSRVILGGNLIGGWAHARDLIYVSRLVRAYHHEQKVFETLYLAERCGINTILTNPLLAGVINRYWDRGLGKMKFISDCALHGKLFDGIRMSIDKGACSCYVQGGIADKYVKNGKIDEIGKALDMIREAGLPAGIGAHRLETLTACIDAGFKPDYWMKTLHTTDYWSAAHEKERDNLWCYDPEGTIEVMAEREEPWIAFKVLAAGAIHPNKAFRHAFKSGADFICVGMYDFQLVEDANIALNVLGGKLDRKRPWRG